MKTDDDVVLRPWCHEEINNDESAAAVESSGDFSTELERNAMAELKQTTSFRPGYDFDAETLR